MGLDTIEIVLEVEQAFAVKLPDTESERIRTVGELFDWIVKQTRDESKNGDCLSAATFYEIRRGFRQLGVDQAIRPATFLCERMPKTGRRAFWLRLRRQCKLAFPELVRPPWIVAAGGVITLVSAMFLGYQFYQSTGSQNLAFFGGFLSFILAGFAISQISKPLATDPHRNWTDFRGLTGTVLARNFPALTRRRNSWNSNDVWIVLHSIIVEQLGVKPEAVTREANFVKDLGCG